MACDRLHHLYAERDEIELKLADAGNWTTLEIRGRRVSRDSALKTLEYLNGQIDRLERLACAGPARNKMRLGRA